MWFYSKENKQTATVMSSSLPNTITMFLIQTSHRYSSRLKTENELDLKV